MRYYEMHILLRLADGLAIVECSTDTLKVEILVERDFGCSTLITILVLLMYPERAIWKEKIFSLKRTTLHLLGLVSDLLQSTMVTVQLVVIIAFLMTANCPRANAMKRMDSSVVMDFLSIAMKVLIGI